MSTKLLIENIDSTVTLEDVSWLLESLKLKEISSEFVLDKITQKPTGSCLVEVSNDPETVELALGSNVFTLGTTPIQISLLKQY